MSQLKPLRKLPAVLYPAAFPLLPSLPQAGCSPTQVTLWPCVPGPGRAPWALCVLLDIPQSLSTSSSLKPPLCFAFMRVLLPALLSLRLLTLFSFEGLLFSTSVCSTYGL